MPDTPTTTHTNQPLHAQGAVSSSTGTITIHRGLLMRALRINLGAGRFVYGGSTVTQQLVKNLFLTRHKSLARKLQELLIATRITQAIDRHRVLELYLNCIEFGPDLAPLRRHYLRFRPHLALTRLARKVGRRRKARAWLATGASSEN